MTMTVTDSGYLVPAVYGLGIIMLYRHRLKVMARSANSYRVGMVGISLLESVSIA